MIPVKINISTKLATKLRAIRKNGETLEMLCQRILEETIKRAVKRQ